MALQKSITFKKKEYPTAYHKIKTIQIGVATTVEGVKRYPLTVWVEVFADSEKDVCLEDKIFHIGQFSNDVGVLEAELTLPAIYTKLKALIGDCTDV